MPSDANGQTADRTLKVYVSSTLLDLKGERDTVVNWLRDLRHVPYHSYVGDSDSVCDSCLRDVEQCDLYVLILGHRYGAPAEHGNGDGLSMTHLEFRHAGEKRIPRIALIRMSVLGMAPVDTDSSPESHRVAGFRDEVLRNVRPAIFTDEASLLHQLSTSFLNEVNKLSQVVRNADATKIRTPTDVIVKAKTIVGQGVVTGGSVYNVNNIKL